MHAFLQYNPIGIPTRKSIKNPTGLSENFLQPAVNPIGKSIENPIELSDNFLRPTGLLQENLQETVYAFLLYNPAGIPIGKSIENLTGLSENFLPPTGNPIGKSIGHSVRFSTV